MLALAPIGLPLIDRASASQGEASPEATPAVMTPEQALELLLTTPFKSPLLPADAGDVTVSEWTDPDDEDFPGAIGGVVIATNPDDLDSFLAIVTIFPDEETARARVEPFTDRAVDSMNGKRVAVGGTTGLSTLVEAPSGLSPDEHFAFSIVSTSFAVIAGSARDESIPGLEFRSIAYLVAAMDHFNRVVAV
jgi:hypothetical protein